LYLTEKFDSKPALNPITYSSPLVGENERGGGRRIHASPKLGGFRGHFRIYARGLLITKNWLLVGKGGF
jgi:hypothetical protein